MSETIEKEPEKEEKPEETKEETKEQEKAQTKEEEKSNTRSYIQYYIEMILRTIFFWEKNPERLGKLIRFFHHITVYLLMISFILLHTITPSFIGLCLYLVYWFFLWLHHIITGGCIISKIEQSFLGDSKSFIDYFLDIFHIPITKETTVGATIMGSTFILFFLAMEVSARTSLYIKSLFS